MELREHPLSLICFGGFLVLLRERRRKQKVVMTSCRRQRTQLTKSQNPAGQPSRLFLAYTVFTVLSFILTLSALAYTFAVSNQTKGQTIDKAFAAHFQEEAYSEDQWTPETWTKALLALPITSAKDASYLRHWLKVTEGWKWNLIPMFLINLVVAALSVARCVQEKALSKVYTK